MRALIILTMLLFPISAHAADPLANIRPEEKTYYHKIFAYAADTIKDDGSYDWKSYSVSGTITLKKTFESKANFTCRNYSETFTVNKSPVPLSREGILCKRKNAEGWCRLEKNIATPSCTFENKNWSESDQLLQDSETMVNKVKNWSPW